MKHFKRSEFECHCGCGFNTVDYELAEVLDELREYFNKPVIITSGCRCFTHNRAVGGADCSQHTRGRAADVVVLETDKEIVADYLEKKYPNGCGIGRYVYKNIVHIDTRSKKSRWVK